MRTWLFHPDAFELWGKLEQDGAGQACEEATRYVVSDHVGLPAALLERTGTVDWTDDGWDKKGGCFVAGTLVVTPEGLVPIEDVRVGDRVLTAWDFARGRAPLPSTTAERASFQAVAAARPPAASSEALCSDLWPTPESTLTLEEAGSGASATNGPPPPRSRRTDELPDHVMTPLSAEAEPHQIPLASKSSKVDIRTRTGLVAAALLSAAAAAPPAPAPAPDVPTDPLERSWHVLELTLVPDGDEGHPYAIELLRPSAWLSERGIDGPGDRVRFALGELDVEGWATLRAVSRVPAPPQEARNVISMILSHESTDVWEITLEGSSNKTGVTGAHPSCLLDHASLLRSREHLVGERLEAAEGALSIEALDGARPYDLDCSLSSVDGSVCGNFVNLEGERKKRLAMENRGTIWSSRLSRPPNDFYEPSHVRGSEALRATSAHPLYSLDRDDWLQVRDLQVGERLQTAEGAVTVEALEKIRGRHLVYNVEVGGDHEYLVGDAGVRAHNTCIPKRVRSRINVSKEGLQHTLERHLAPGRVNKSQFSMGPDAVKELLQSKTVVRAEVRALPDSGNFVREVDMGYRVGNRSLTRGGAPTNVLSVITDKYGNLKSAFPGRVGD